MVVVFVMGTLALAGVAGMTPPKSELLNQKSIRPTLSRAGFAPNRWLYAKPSTPTSGAAKIHEHIEWTDAHPGPLAVGIAVQRGADVRIRHGRVKQIGDGKVGIENSDDAVTVIGVGSTSALASLIRSKLQPLRRNILPSSENATSMQLLQCKS